MTQSLEINNQNFVLHSSGVLFWMEKSMLLISDVHLGKVSHFRKFGAAVPQEAIQKNFDLMDEVVAHFHPETIVFMGDLFHSSLNSEWDLFEKWTLTVSSKMILIVGNHDIISQVKYEELNIVVVSEIESEGFLLTHHPELREGFFNFCGHIHPAIKLNGIGKQSVRLRCFFKSEAQLLLPAFGEFTGSHTMKPDTNSEVFALVGDAVLPVPTQSVRRRKRGSN